MSLKACFYLCFSVIFGLSVFSQEFTQSNLPIVIIETNGQNIPDEPKITVEMGIIYNGAGQINFITDPFNEYNGVIGIEKRGSTSQWFFPKKQYAFETRDAEGNNLNVSLLGLPPENDWILHAPYSDKSLMRNVISYKIASEMGHYAPRTVYCELVINGDYKGIYIIMEKIKRDENRVDIAELDENDLAGDSLTGGYIIKIDKNEGSSNDGWNSQFPPYPGAWQNVYYQYHYPKPDNIKYAQKQYIQQFIYDFEAVMNGNNYSDPESGYAAIIDVNAFTDYILLNEFTKNVDAYRISTFLYKDRNSKNGKLKAGPVWDYNIALGNADYSGAYFPEDWIITSEDSHNDNFVVTYWWVRLFEDPAFFQNMILRWNIFRNTILQNNSINNFIDNTVLLLDEAQQRNFERWPILGEYVWPNYFIGDTYEQEVEFLEEWIDGRIDWMDEQLKLQPIINEINYLPLSENNPGDWLEIYNPNNESIDLANWKLKNGNATLYTFPIDSYLPANSYLVVCENIVLFHSIFPEVENYVGNMQSELNNEAASIELFNSSNLCVDMLNYSDELPWPNIVNGTGFTIELMYSLTDNSKGGNWQISEQYGGSPGQPNSVSLVPELYINEFMADNESLITDEYDEYDDWIEIYNASASAINIGGKFLSDDKNIPHKFQIPNTEPEITTIAPGEFLLLWADKEPAQGVLHLDFKLSKLKEQIGLYLADGKTIIDTVSYGQQITDISYGRISDANPEWVFMPIATPEASNTIVSIPDEIINSDLVIYPNPVKNWLYLNIPDEFLNNSQIVICNLFGQILINSDIKSNHEKLNLVKLKSGFYSLSIYSENKRINKKFIKH